MPVLTANFDPFKRELDDHKTFTIGTFEAWICSQCGFTEWYAKDVNESLAILSRTFGTGVRFYHGQPKAGPYR